VFCFGKGKTRPKDIKLGIKSLKSYVPVMGKKNCLFSFEFNLSLKKILFLLYDLDPDLHGSSVIFKAGSGSTFTKKTGSGSAISQCGSETLDLKIKFLFYLEFQISLPVFHGLNTFFQSAITTIVIFRCTNAHLWIAPSALSPLSSGKLDDAAEDVKAVSSDSLWMVENMCRLNSVWTGYMPWPLGGGQKDTAPLHPRTR
jgi:hypothetical protein